MSNRTEIMKILALSEGERAAQGLPVTLDEIAEVYDAHPLIIEQWEKELPEWKKEQETEDTEGYDSLKFLEKRTRQADRSLLRQIKSGSSTATKLFYQLVGMLTEKQEVTHKLDGSLLARQVLEARRELDATGMAQVPDESRILPEKLCLDSGQNPKKDD